jgi:hypothetical protein
MSTNTKDISIVKLESPRFEDSRPLLIAGLGGATANTLDDLPALWKRFSVHIGRIPGQAGRAAYGVCSDMFNGDGQLPLPVGRGGLRIFGSSDIIQPRADSGTVICDISSPRTRIETSLHGQCDLVAVAPGIGPQICSRGRWCSGLF